MTLGEGVGQHGPLQDLQTVLDRGSGDSLVHPLDSRSILADIVLDSADLTVSKGLDVAAIGQFLGTNIGASIGPDVQQSLGFDQMEWAAAYHHGDSPPSRILFLGYFGKTPELSGNLYRHAGGAISVEFSLESGDTAAQSVQISGTTGPENVGGPRIVCARYSATAPHHMESMGVSFAPDEYPRASADTMDFYEHIARYGNVTSLVNLPEHRARVPGFVTPEMKTSVASAQLGAQGKMLVAVEPPISQSAKGEVDYLRSQISAQRRILERLEKVKMENWRRLSFFEQDKLADLPETIAGLEAELAEVQASFHQPPRVRFGDGGQLKPGSPTPYTIHHEDGSVELGVCPEPSRGRRGNNPRFAAVMPAALTHLTPPE